MTTTHSPGSNPTVHDPEPDRLGTSRRAWAALFGLNAVLLAANYPRAVRYLNDLRPAGADAADLSDVSYSVGAAVALVVASVVCLLFYSLAAQLDRSVLLGLVPLGRLHLRYFFVVAALSTTVANAGRLLLGEFRVAADPAAGAVALAACILVPLWLARSQIAAMSRRGRWVVLGLTLLMPALVILL